MKQCLLHTFLMCSLPIGLIVALVVCGVTVGSPATTVSIEPNTSAFLPNRVFNITVTIANVTGLYGWEFNMTFNPSVLKWLSFYEGPFLKQAGDTYQLPASHNDTAGWVSAGRVLFPYPEDGAAGNGILAYVTFNATAEGTSNLHFDVGTTNLRTIDQNQMPVAISFTPVDGSVKVALVHDVAVTALTVSEPKVTVGTNVSVQVTVRNKGSVAETFNVTLSYGSTVIKVERVSQLASGASHSLSFTWNTKDASPGDYTLTATVSTLQGETETADNTYSNVVVKVESPPPMLPMELLVGAVVAVVVVVGVGTFFFMKRRSGKK